VVKRLAFAVPGDLATPTGGYGYDRRVIAELQGLGWQVDLVPLGDGFPRPNDGQRAFALAQLKAVPEGVPVVIDGLAFGAMPEEAEAVQKRSPLVALVHHPLALETGLAPADADKLFESERRALALAHRVVVTSPATGQRLSDEYDVPPETITVAPPGTDRGTKATGSTDGAVRLLAVGSVVPRKGFDVLIAALAPLADLNWRLTIAGDLTRDQGAAAKLEADVAEHRLVGRVDLLGAVSQERLSSLYSSSDIFVLASHFEGYGMAYAEAMAHGLPVIGTTGGAIGDTVPPNAGVLVEPGDVKALTRALRMLIENEAERRWFADGALAAAADLPTWPETARRFAGAIEGLT
jgi:glycosyltransferase involved in cell wall biosynthesis